MVFIHRHSLNLRLNISICRPCSAVLSTKVLCAAPTELGISRHLACAVGTLQGLTGTISPREKPYKVFWPGLSQIMKVCFICRVTDGKKKTLRSSQDSNLGPLNSSQMLLPTEPLQLWHWSGG